MVNKIPEEYENPVDVVLLKLVDKQLDFYKSLCLTPNMLTTFSLVSGLYSAFFIYKGQFIIASVLYMVSYYFDCADGKFARKFNMTSKFGDYYDHISDVIKLIFIVYALYCTNPKYFSNVIVIAPLLLLLLCIQMGYQEVIYDKDDSDSISVIKKLVEKDNNPERTIKYTKYFGSGSINLIIAIIIFLWQKA
jgi:phosphatidylglycerophosphate synthase